MERRRFRYILYLMPAIMDCVTGIFFFIGPVRATILGYDPLIAGSVVSSRSVACCVFSVIISRYLSSATAARFIYGGSILLIAACLLGLGATNLTMLYVTSALCGAAVVTISASLQVFLKVVDSGEKRSLSQVVGSYTASWCIGMSFGPFITGFLMEMGRPKESDGLSIGWVYTYLAAAVLSTGMFLAFLWIKKTTGEFMRRHRERANTGVITADKDSAGMPDLAWLGWIAGFMGACANGMVRGAFPSGVTRAGMPEWRSGLIMMILSLAMGIFAYSVSLGRKWMYSPRTLLLFACLGVVGLNLYVLPYYMGWGIVDHSWQYYLAALLFGCYSGTTYLYSAYHGLAHPDKDGRNISLNETFIATGMMLGPVLGGWVAKHFGFFPPYLVSATLVFALGVLQFTVHRRYRQGQPA